MKRRQRIIQEDEKEPIAWLCWYSNNVLNKAIDNLATPITLIFDICLQAGVIPDEWKVAGVAGRLLTPIYKG